jgi:hypothetical protein
LKHNALDSLEKVKAVRVTCAGGVWALLKRCYALSPEKNRHPEFFSLEPEKNYDDSQSRASLRPFSVQGFKPTSKARKPSRSRNLPWIAVQSSKA